MSNRILINHVKRAACAVYGVTTLDIEGSDRHRRFSEPRHMAMAVARQLTDQSWAAIGRAFKRTDAAVIQATQAISGRTLKSPKDYETYFEIARLARAYAAGDDLSPTFSRSGDLGFVPDEKIRDLHRKSVSPWTIARQCGVPIAEVTRVLQGA